MLTRIPTEDGEIIVAGDIGVAVVETCSRFGCKFLRGIWPQSKCGQCSISEGHHMWSARGRNE